MTERGVTHVHELSMKLPEHFNRGKRCRWLLTVILWGGNEVFYCAWCDLPWDSGEWMPRKYCKVVGGRHSWLLWEMLVLKTWETCYRSLVVWPQQLDFFKTSIFFRGCFQICLFVCYFIEKIFLLCCQVREWFCFFQKVLHSVEMTAIFHDF